MVFEALLKSTKTAFRTFEPPSSNFAIVCARRPTASKVLLVFLYTNWFNHWISSENFHYFPEGALGVCPYLHMPRAKREPKYTLFEFVEAAKAMENLVGIEPYSRLLK